MFAALFTDDPRQLVECFASSEPKEQQGYEAKTSENFKEPLTRYDLLQVLLTVCDELELIRSKGAAGIQEVANRAVSRDGWLSTLPLAFDWFLDVYPAATTATVLERYSLEDEVLGSGSILELVGLPDVWDTTQGPLTVDNVQDFVHNTLLPTVKSVVLPQIEALRSGVEDVLPLDALDRFYPEELCELMCGTHSVRWSERDLLEKVFQLDQHPTFRPGDPVILALASVVHSFDEHTCGQFLEFVTGLARLPPGEKLRIGVVKQNAEMPHAGNCAPFRLWICDYYKKALDPDALGWDDNHGFESGSAVEQAWKDAKVAKQACWPDHGTDAAAAADAPGTYERSATWVCEEEIAEVQVSVDGQTIKLVDNQTECTGTIGSDGTISGTTLQRDADGEYNEGDRGQFEFKLVSGSAMASGARYNGTISLETDGNKYGIQMTIGSSRPATEAARFAYTKALLRFTFLLAFQEMVSGGYVH